MAWSSFLSCWEEDDDSELTGYKDLESPEHLAVSSPPQDACVSRPRITEENKWMDESELWK